jgi:hypothetical protein
MLKLRIHEKAPNRTPSGRTLRDRRGPADRPRKQPARGNLPALTEQSKTAYILVF